MDIVEHLQVVWAGNEVAVVMGVEGSAAEAALAAEVGAAVAVVEPVAAAAQVVEVVVAMAGEERAAAAA